MNQAPMRMANASLYTYAVRFIAIPASGTQSQNITIDNDADFDAFQGVYWANDTTANKTLSSIVAPSAVVDILTQDTQRMNNIALPITMLFGDARNPLVLPQVRRFNRRTVITFNVTNLDGGGGLNLWLGFVGRKVYT
jgi:hypothetical protein